MTKKEQLLKQIEEQKNLYMNDLLLDVKEKFAKNIKIGLEHLAKELVDADYDFLLEEKNLMSKFLNDYIIESLKFNEYGCGWKQIDGYLYDRRMALRHSSKNEEM